MEYYIFVTNDCNLNCQYCSVLLNMEKSGLPKEPIYSIDELNNFIDETQQEFSDEIADVIFFGGEPTLNYNFIKNVINSQKEFSNENYRYNYMLHTNGLLLSKIPIEVLDSIDSILLSINYEKIPKQNLNEGYFKSVIDSVNHVKRHKNIPIVARLTITENTSLYSEISLISPFFDAIYWQLENKYQFKNFKKFYKSYEYEIKLVFDLWIKYLKNGILLRFIPIMASVNFLHKDKQPSAFCCGYNDSMIYIQTNGNCYTCAEDMTTNKNLIGDIKNKINFENFNLNNTICNSCEYLNMCKGRCGRMHKEFSLEHVQEYCELNKILFNLVKENKSKIHNYCQNNNLKIELDDFIYHYTEYTP